VLPLLSVTVQVTVVVPIGNADGALLLTEATPQLSAVAGVPRATPVAVHPVLVVVFTFAGHVMVGSTLSVTVTVWLQVAVLPLLSVTVQVTVVVPIGNAAGALLETEATPQLSAVTGVPRATPVAVHPVLVVAFTFTGQVMVGSTLSVTVTVWLQVAVLPLLSVTVQITVVVPIRNAAGALLETEATPQLSAVTGVPRATPVAVHPVLVVVFTFVGQVMVGRVMSVTVTVWLQVAVLPLLSVTVQVTVVVPIGKADGALLLTEAIPQLSPVTGVPRATPVAVHPVLVVAFTFTGQVMVGSTLSVTVTVWLQVAVLPLLSVTVQVTVVVPIENAEGALLLTEATPQLSAVTGVPRATPVAVHPVLVVVFTFTGQVMVGSTLSVTVTVWLQVAVLPLLSVTVQVTVVVPIGYAAGALLLTEATPQLSAVTGVPRATPVAVHPVLVVAFTFAGQLMVGSTLSVTVTV
jgi:hypothetical protein